MHISLFHKLLVSCKFSTPLELGKQLNAIANNREVTFKVHNMIFVATTKTMDQNDYTKWMAVFKETRGLPENGKWARHRDNQKRSTNDSDSIKT